MKISRLFIYLFIFFFLTSLHIRVNAHSELLEVEYDNCDCSCTNDGADEIWYYLCEARYSQGPDYEYFHLPDDVTTIKYYIYNNSRYDSSYSWNTDVSDVEAQEIINAYVESMKKWNDVYYYSYDNYGNLVSNKIIDIVEGTLDDHNLSIYPIALLNNIVAITDHSDMDSTSNLFNDNISHIHYNNWVMDVNVVRFSDDFEESNQNRLTVGAHEMGHILGLDDIDICCKYVTNQGDHHGEVIMGYEIFGFPTTDITYKDIAGVSITRGFHTDDDHKWMKRINTDGTIDLICSLCNGVIFNVEVSDFDTIYNDNEIVNYYEVSDHSSNHDLLLVATNGKSDFYKCKNCRYIESKDIVKEFNLNCYSNESCSSRFCNVNISNEELVYKINVECSETYVIESFSVHPFEISFYDSNNNLSSTVVPMMSDNSCYGTISTYLYSGEYYLKVKYINNTDSGEIFVSCKASFPSCGEILTLDVDTNMKNHLHLGIDGKYISHGVFYNTEGTGFYKVSLSKYPNYTNNYGTIKVYEDSEMENLMKRYNVNGMESSAFSYYDESEMFLYLIDGATYYFEVILPYNSYVYLNLKIEKAEANDFDYTEFLNYQSYNILFENESTQTYFEEVKISHRSKYQLDIFANGITQDTIPICIFKKTDVNDALYDENNCILLSDPTWYLTINNHSPFYTFILDAGTYYFGFINNQHSAFISFSLKRIIDYDASSLSPLVADPALNQGYTLGSEVLFNEGSLNNTYITEGFTRCLYLIFERGIEIPNSRLDYDWYSSNENVAVVSQFGTVLAKQVDQNIDVTIYAVLKIDPSVVYSIVFHVLDDNNTDYIEIETNLSYNYQGPYEHYQLLLNNNNCPYAMFTYYNWNIDILSNYSADVSINNWGQIMCNIPCNFLLTGEYVLNPRVVLKINIVILS